MTDIYLSPLAHPYARYGLAAALLQARLNDSSYTETEVREALIQALETGIEHFRMSTQDNPKTAEVLRYSYVKASELVRDHNLIYSKGLSIKGIFLAPTVVTNEIDKQQGAIIQGTFNKAVEIANKLRAGESLISSFEFSRSFAPTTQKINNGKSSQTPPKGTLFEAACSSIATLSHSKPAARVEKSNTAIVPDLPLNELKDFVELFQQMMTSELDGNLYEAKLPPKKPEAESATKKKKRKKESEDAVPKSEYRRPRLHNGNYPFAPRDAAFGAVGLLGAIGRWARRANQVAWAKRVLDSIAGTEERPGRPLYIVSYDDISQVQFTHHVVGLSIEGKLSVLIEKLIRETQLYAMIESGKPNWDSTAYKLFYLMAGRFLQQFTTPSFRDFLASRAEYAPEVQPLFEEYFMQARKINREIVESARALGQWLNRTAYFVADSEVKPDAPDRAARVRKEKAKILVEFESAAMSAKTPQDMLHRISTRAGRLLQQEAPVEATCFMDATNSGEIEPEDALHLLIAYLRLRSAKIVEPNGASSRKGGEDGYGIEANA